MDRASVVSQEWNDQMIAFGYVAHLLLRYSEGLR